MRTKIRSRARVWLRISAAALLAALLARGAASPVWDPLPGAPPMPPEVVERLTLAYEKRGPAVEPRTAHLRTDGTPRYLNRLILEDSPYLLQHAHNPVDWHPWGAAALQRARELDRPLFISVGYSTCYWCHVMERESFDEETIAGHLNANFVPVKVDRERRPDVDEIYVTAARISAGHAGWPLNVFALPDGRPFFVTTYVPPDEFREILKRVAALWRERRDRLERAGADLAAAVEQAMAARREARAVDGRTLYEKALQEILSEYDEFNGGFGTAPKFPEENRLLLLLDHVWRTGDPEALEALLGSLDAMARGGIFDQVGGGFHRYAVDPQWLIPHFEKMLYNQARLARLYAGAWALTGRAALRRVAEQTLDYVLADLTAPSGAFYSARDAESEGREGAFYLWTAERLRAVLGARDGTLAAALFGVTGRGDFEGENVLHLPEPIERFMREHGASLSDYERIRARLRAARAQRPAPHRDEKVITAWNGMMIAALADAARLFGEPCTLDGVGKPEGRRCPYLEAARRAAAVLLRMHRRGDRVWRLSLHGRADVDGLLQDYAWLAEGLVALYDADGDARWLDAAQALARAMVARFQDPDSGAFYLTAHDADTPLFMRPRSPADGALPSGDAIAVRVLARLAARTGDAGHHEAAARALAARAADLRARPADFPYLLVAARLLQAGAAGPLRYAARGRVRLAAALEPLAPPAGRVRLRLDIRPGWHVNGPDPGMEGLIPTRLLADEAGPLVVAGPIVYPPALRRALRFAGRQLTLYEGTAEIAVPVRVSPAEGPDRTIVGGVRLELQACSDEACLAPEQPQVTVALWPLLGALNSHRHGE